MIEEKVFTYEEFKRIIERLESNKIKYFVFGGYYMDALTNEESEHRDLDIFIFESQLKLVKTILKEFGYFPKKIGRLISFTKKIGDVINDIDILILKEFKDYYRMRGNLSEDFIPKEAFNQEKYLKIKEVSFRVMPLEWFLLYRGVKHLHPTKQKRHDKAMKIVESLAKPLKKFRSKPISRLKSDPKYGK